MEWHLINWIVIAFYLLILISVSIYFSKHISNTKEYFLGNKDIPAWIMAFSLYSTALSSISYIANTANIYQHGWIYITGIIGAIPLLFLTTHFFIPFIRRINCISAYEYLELRFNKSLRLFASLVFILFHILRIAIILYLLTSVFIEIWPHINPIILIFIVGFLCILYTTIGGFEAVVWSDAIQTLILLCAAFLIIGYGFSSVPKGVNPFEILASDNRIFSKEHFSFDPKTVTIWWLVLSGFFNSLYQYIGSQDIAQRYSASKNLKDAKKTLYYQVPLLALSTIIFTGMGSALYLFYKFSGVPIPELQNPNTILPYFIIHQLPIGISGLVISGIFATGQSTISSSLNSTASCLMIDFILPFNKNISNTNQMKYSKAISLFIGMASLYIAMQLLKQKENNNAYILFNSILGLLGGPISGIFLIGIFMPKANSQDVWTGCLFSICSSIYLANPANILHFIPGYTKPEIFGFLFAPIVLFICIFFTGISTLIHKRTIDLKKIEGLTYRSLKNQTDIL